MLPAFGGFGKIIEFISPKPKLLPDFGNHRNRQHEAASLSFFIVIAAGHSRSSQLFVGSRKKTASVTLFAFSPSAERSVFPARFLREWSKPPQSD